MDILNKYVVLEKIQDTRVNKHNPVYVSIGEKVTGYAHENPEVNERFHLYGDNGIDTSPVVTIDDDKMQLHTLNSIYQLTIISD